MHVKSIVIGRVQNYAWAILYKLKQVYIKQI